LRGRDALVRLGVGLFLAGTFVMISGDLPRPELRALQRLALIRVVTSSWFYLALLALALLVLAASDVRALIRPVRMSALNVSVALLTAALFVSVLFSQVRSLSWFAFGGVLGVLGFGFLAAQLLRNETLRAGTSVVVGAAALVLAVRVLVFRAEEGLGVGAFHITNNAWLGKLQIAWVLNFAAPFVLARFIAAPTRLASAFYGLTWLASGATIHFLYSRTGSLAFGLTTLAMCALNRRSWRRWLTLVAITAGLGLAVMARTGGTSIYVTSVVAADRDSGIVMRRAVWRDTVPMIKDHPVTGIGLGTYDDVAYSQYRSVGEREFFRNGWHAHNVFLHVLAETGIIGFAAWCYFWFAIVRFLLRRWAERDESDRLHSVTGLCLVLAFFVLSLTEVLIAARVHASLRMNLTLALFLGYGCSLASGTVGRQASGT
jgi:O-antigen ligase